MAKTFVELLAGPEPHVAADAGYEQPPQRKGFFTDTSVCIGCKACEVACKEWNQVPDDMGGFTGMSFDNTIGLGANSWRHVAFIEQPRVEEEEDAEAGSVRWLMSSDVCKHCTHAACLDVCPTGALIRTEFGTVVVQEDVCNGCGYCVPACPYGVIDQRPRRPRLQMHLVLRPARCRNGTSLRESVPDRIDPVR